MIETAVPHTLALGFEFFLLVFLAGLFSVFKNYRLQRLIRWMSVWILVIAVVAMTGFFKDFDSLPPRMGILVVIQFALIFWVVWKSPLKNQLASIPHAILIGLQSFRIIVEILLVQLYENKLLPIEMTLNGRNFDIITGLTAIPVAYWVHKKGEENCRTLIRLWNLMGLALVTAVVVHGMLSMPYPFQVLHLDPPNRVIAVFPIIFLPTVFVAAAYLLHFVSLRKLRHYGKNPPS